MLQNSQETQQHRIAWLYVVLKGTPHPVTRLRTMVQEATQSAGTAPEGRILLGSETPLVHGFDHAEEGSGGRLWYRVRAPSPELWTLTAKLEKLLGWQAQIYWGVADNEDILPPFPGPLMRSRQHAYLSQSSSRNLYRSCVFEVLLIATVLLFAGVGLQGMTVALWVSLGICVLASLRYLEARARLKAEGSSAATDAVVDESTIRVRMSKAVRYQVGLVLVELVLVVTYAATGHGQVLSQLSLESWGMLLVALLLGVGISWLAIESCIRLLSRRHGDVPKNLQLWEAIANLKDDFVPRAIEARCITCGLSLKGMDSCRCPDCGTINYYLIDRDDARHLAKENGAVF